MSNALKTTALTLLVAGFSFLPCFAVAQEARLANVPTKTTSRTPVAEGSTVFGVFDGRFPCAEIARDWKQPVRPECEKVKWSLTLLHDPTTRQPTTYRLRGTMNPSRTQREGKWAVVRGTPTDPEAAVIQLDPDQPLVSVYLFRGDDNVLFVLDQQRRFRVGTDYLSYTLNRVVN